MADPNLLEEDDPFKVLDPLSAQKKAFYDQAAGGPQYGAPSVLPARNLQGGSTFTAAPTYTQADIQRAAFEAQAREGTDWQSEYLAQKSFLQQRLTEDTTGQNLDKYFNSVYMAHVMETTPEFVWSNYDMVAKTFVNKQTSPDPGALAIALRKAWDNGTATTQLGYLYYRMLEGGENEYLKKRIAYWESRVTPINNKDYGLLGQLMLGAADMLPLQVIAGIEGAKVGLATAATMGIAAAATATPFMVMGGATGIGAVPTIATSGVYIAAATMWGFVTGTAAGSAVESGKIMMGLAYKQLKELTDVNGNPISDRTARLIAIPVGTLVGIIEVMQMGAIAESLSPGLKKIMGEGIREMIKGTVTKTLGNAALKAGVKYGVDVLSEGGEEGVQEVVQIMGEILAKYIEHNAYGKEFEPKTIEEYALRVWENTRAGIMGTILTLAPGHIRGAFTEGSVATKISAAQQAAAARKNELIAAGKLAKEGVPDPTSSIQDAQTPLGEVPSREPWQSGQYQATATESEHPEVAPKEEVSQPVPVEAVGPETHTQAPEALTRPVKGTVGEAVSALEANAKPYMFTKEEWAAREKFRVWLHKEKVGVSVFQDVATQKYAWFREQISRAAPQLTEEEVLVDTWFGDMLSKVIGMPLEDMAREIFAPGIFATPEQLANFKEDVALRAREYAESQVQWTPEQKQEYISRQEYQAAVARGAAKFVGNGKRLIYVFQSGDASTVIEEFLHAARPYIPEHMLDPLRPWLGLTPGQEWTVEAEEKLAKALFVYVSEGRAPNEASRTILRKLAQWVESLYKLLKDRIVLSPEVITFYDTIFSQRFNEQGNEQLRIQPNPRPADTLDVLYQIDDAVAIENDPGNVETKDFLLQSSYQKAIKDIYVEPNGQQRGQTDEHGEFHVIHSYASPVNNLRLKLGQWLIDDGMKGLYGHEIAQLRKFDYTQIRRLGDEWQPGDVTMSEDLVEWNQQGRGDHATRYAEWMESGLTAPPVTIIETDKGTFKITDGHRRANAAIMAKQPLYAWVWPAMQHPRGLLDSSTGKTQVVGMTYEGMTGKTFIPEEMKEFLFQIDPKDEEKMAKAAKLPAWKGGWGITKDPAECGYILRDGTMLDLSGKYNPDRIAMWKQRMPERVKIDAKGHEWIPDMAGGRGMDHNEMPAAVKKNIKNVTNLRGEWLKRTGAMRVDLQAALIEMFEEPTPEQISVAAECYAGKKSIYCELVGSDYSSIYSAQLDRPTGQRIADWFNVAPMMGQKERGSFLFQEDPDKIAAFNKQAVDFFGVTDDPKRCGFILSDGSMLDFANKWGETKTVWENGRMVHRMIGKVPSIGMIDSLNKALKHRTLRMDFDRTLTMMQTCYEPTEAQYQQIEQIVRKTGQLEIEYTDPSTGRMLSFFEFKGRTFPPSRQSIKNHFTAHEFYSKKYLFDVDPWAYKSVEVVDKFADKIEGQPAENVKNILLKNGVKPEEMKWNDLDEYFAEKKKNGEKISYADLKAYIGLHSVKLEELLFGFPATLPTTKQPARPGRPVYPNASWQSAIGDHYRELVMRLPWTGIPQTGTMYRSIPGQEEELRKINQDLAALTDAKLAVRASPMFTIEKKAELLNQMDSHTEELMNRRDMLFEYDPNKFPQHTIPKLYEGNPHYQGIDNVVGWIRFKDYQGSLLIDEVQSEWFQNVRELRNEKIDRIRIREGITEEEASKRVKESDYLVDMEGMLKILNSANMSRAWREAAAAKLGSFGVSAVYPAIGRQEFSTQRTSGGLLTTIAKLYWNAKAEQYDLTKNLSSVTENADEISATLDEYREAMNLQSKYTDEAGRYPSAPFMKTWVELCMKRMIRWAAELGYTKIMWTDGEMQRQRWRLSNMIDTLLVTKWQGSLYDLEGYSEGHERFSKGKVQESELKGIIGKELAERLISLPEPTDAATPTMKEFQKTELDLLGKGMKFQYDTLMVRFVNDYCKKWGEQVYDIDLTVKTANAPRLVYHAVNINDEMRRSAVKPYLFQGDPHAEAVREAVQKKQAVPDNVLAEYKQFAWAQEEIVRREAYVTEALSGDFKNLDEYVDYHDATSADEDVIADYEYWALIWDRASGIEPHLESVQYRPLSKKEANARFIASVGDPASLGKYFEDLISLSDGNIDTEIFPKAVRIAFEAARAHLNNTNIDAMAEVEFDAAFKSIQRDPALYRGLLAQFGDDKERQQLIHEEKKGQTDAEKLRAAQLAILRSVKQDPPPEGLGRREIWTITKQEWVDAYPASKRKPRDFLRMHEYAVRQAVERGFTPPDEVLDDYPYLRERIEQEKRKPKEWVEPRQPILYSSEQPDISPENMEIIEEAFAAMGRSPTPALIDTFAVWAQGDFDAFYANFESMLEREHAAQLYKALQGAFELKMETEQQVPVEEKVKQELFGFAEKSGVALQDELNNLALFPDVVNPQVPETKEAGADGNSGIQPTPEQRALITPKPTDVEPEPTLSGAGPNDPGKPPYYSDDKFPVERIQQHPEIFNFKEEANRAGVVEPLTGERYIREGVAPIVIWQTMDGNFYVITGRHRLDLAKRLGEKDIPVHIYKEADGFTLDMARIFDAESNIRDEKGSVRDYAAYFRATGITEEQASRRGLLARVKGKNGFALGAYASDDLYNGYRNRVIGEKEAVAVARGAPRSPEVQASAMRKRKEFADSDALENYAMLLYEASKQREESGAKQIDLFGRDEALEKELDSMAVAKAKLFNLVKQEMAALNGARRLTGGKRAEFLAPYGITITDTEAIDERLDELEMEFARWSNKRWTQDREIVNRVREEAGLKPLEDSTPDDVVVPVAPQEVPVLPPPPSYEPEVPAEVPSGMPETETEPEGPMVPNALGVALPEWTEKDGQEWDEFSQELRGERKEPRAGYKYQFPYLVAREQLAKERPGEKIDSDEITAREKLIEPQLMIEEYEAYGEKPRYTVDGKLVRRVGTVVEPNVVVETKKKGWWIKITVAQFEDGWTWGGDFHFDTGNMAGNGTPCCDIGPKFSTMNEAILDALSTAQHHFSYYSQEGHQATPGQVAAGEQAQKYIATQQKRINEEMKKAEIKEKEPSDTPKIIVDAKAREASRAEPEPAAPVTTPEIVRSDPVIQQDFAVSVPTGGAVENPIALPGGQLALNITVTAAQLEMEQLALQEQIADLKESAKGDERIWKDIEKLTNTAGRLEREIALARMREKMGKRIADCQQRRKDDRARWKAAEQGKRQQQQVDKLLNDMRKIKDKLKYMHPEAAEPIRELLDDIDLSISGKGFIRNLSKLKSALEGEESIDIPADWISGLDAVAGKSIYALTYNELQNLANNVMFWYNYNRELETIRVGSESQRKEEAIERALGEMKKENELLSHINAIQKPGEKRWESVKRFLNTMLGIGQMQYNLIVEWVAGQKSVMYDLFVRKIGEGRRKELELKHSWEDFWTARMEMLNIGNLQRWLGESYDLEIQQGRVLTLTRGQKISLYLHSQNFDNRESITGAGIGFRRNTQYRNRPLKVSEAALGRLAKEMTPTEIRLVKIAQDMMDIQAEAMDPVYLERYGFPLPRIENYWHKDVMPVGRGKTTEEESAIEAARRRTMRPGVPKGRTKERAGVVVPIYLNSVEQDIMDSINEAAAYAGLEIPVYQAYKLLSDRDFKQALSDRYGELLVREINNGLRDIVGESHALPLIEQYFAKTRQMLQTAYLTLNPFTWLKLMLGYLNGLTYVKAQYMAQGFADFIMHPMRTDQLNQAMSPYYRDRMEIGFTRDVAEPQKTYESGKLIKAKSWYRKMGVKPLQMADRVAVNPVMRGAYLQAMHEMETGKLSESVQQALVDELQSTPVHALTPIQRIELAYRYADWVVQRTQDQRLPEYRSPLSRATALGGLTKFFTMFGSNTNTNLNIILRAVNNLRQNPGSKTAIKQLAGTIFLMMVIVPASEAMVNAIRNFMLRRYGDDEDRWKQVLNDYGNNVTSLSYFLRDSWQAINAGVKGQWGSELQIAPVQVMNDTYRAVADTIKAMTDRGTYNGNKWAKAADEMVELVMLYSQIPGIMPKRYIQELIKNSKE